VSDIFSEVDEEVRREQLKRIWARYGNVIVALAVLVVIGVGAWRGYQWWEGRKAAETGAAFEAAADLADQGKGAEAAAAFDKIAAESGAGYRALARLRAAAALSDRTAAVAAYDALAADTSVSPVFRDLAGVRAGLLLVDSAPLADMTRRLEPLAQANGTFRHTARELLAFAAVRGSDSAAAKRWIDMIEADTETPPTIRARVELLNALGEAKS